MAEFPEKVRLEAKRLSAFKCCYCHERPGDDVHHIHPQKDGGSNDIGNAAYLCAQCHRDHGNNPDKQKRVLEARDWWYEVVRTRYAPPALDILQSFVEVVATKDDVARVEQNLRGMLDDVINAYKGGDTTGFELINVASTMVSSTSSPPSVSTYTPASSYPRRCTLCGHKWEDFLRGMGYVEKCLSCGKTEGVRVDPRSGDG